MSIHEVSAKVAVVSKFREYSETDKHLGGLIKVNRITHTEKWGQDVYIVVPVDSERYDRFYINGVEYKPVKLD